MKTSTKIKLAGTAHGTVKEKDRDKERWYGRDNAPNINRLDELAMACEFCSMSEDIFQTWRVSLLPFYQPILTKHFLEQCSPRELCGTMFYCQEATRVGDLAQW